MSKPPPGVEKRLLCTCGGEWGTKRLYTWEIDQKTRVYAVYKVDLKDNSERIISAVVTEYPALWGLEKQRRFTRGGVLTLSPGSDGFCFAVNRPLTERFDEDLVARTTHQDTFFTFRSFRVAGNASLSETGFYSLRIHNRSLQENRTRYLQKINSVFADLGIEELF